MALPKVNEVLKFTLTVPSTKQTVRYRPYLVKEEKILLQAFESKDVSACVTAMCDTLDSCIEKDSGVDVWSLPTFDLEYMFLKIRSKSVGESSDIIVRCREESCGHGNPISVDLEQVEVGNILDDNIIDITDSIKVEMKYPTYDAITESEMENENLDVVLDMITKCIVAVHTAEERIETSTLGKGELQEFLESMTATQLKNVTSYLEEMPSLTHDISFQCEKCGIDNELTLRGLSDFF